MENLSDDLDESEAPFAQLMKNAVQDSAAAIVG